MGYELPAFAHFYFSIHVAQDFENFHVMLSHTRTRTYT